MIGKFLARIFSGQSASKKKYEHLEDFFQNASVGLHWEGPDGRILMANRAELDILGYEVSEYVGQKVSDFHVDKSVIEGMLERLAHGEIVHGESARMWAKDGSIVDVLIDSSALFEEGKFVHTRGFTRNVTELNKTESAAAILAAIVEDSDDAIISKTLEGIITSWNKSAEGMFGYTAEEIIGQSIHLIIPMELRDQESMILGRLRNGIRMEHFETVRVAKDGRKLQVSLTVSPIRDKSGQVIGASKVARDITERKNAESKARFLADVSATLANLVNYESTLQKVAQLAVPTFADWCVVDLLENASKLKRVAITHVDPEKIATAEELRRLMAPHRSNSNGIWRVVKSGRSEFVPVITDEMIEASDVEDEIKKAILNLGLKSYIAVPLTIRGTVFGAISFVSAESGRKYTGQDLAFAEDIADRAAIAIENARLFDEARRTDQRKDEFLATLAHELRNPLAPIRNALDIGRHLGHDPNAMGEVWDLLTRQVDQMVHLVDDLLDLSRITSDKLEMRFAETPLSPILEQSLEAVKPIADRLQIDIKIHAPNQPIFLMADPVRIAQVLINLLNNACKFSKECGHVAVFVEVEDQKVRISVKDTGVGIPPENLETIFQMFSQVELARERSRGGLGIGLALVKRIIELHGGTVSATSPGLGHGANFTVILPAHETMSSESKMESTVDQSESSGFRILVVDDNRDSALTMAALLRLAGNTLETAHDGLEASEKTVSFQPDVVLLDIGLPKMNGYDACRAIRAQPGGQERFIVAMTGWGQDEDRRMSKEAGFNLHLVKPVESKVVLKLLAEIRTKSPQNASSEPNEQL